MTSVISYNKNCKIMFSLRSRSKIRIPIRANIKILIIKIIKMERKSVNLNVDNKLWWMKHLVILLIEMLTLTVQINRILIVEILSIKFYSQKNTTR